MFEVMGRDFSKLQSGQFAVYIHKCRLLPLDEQIYSEPPSTGNHSFYAVTNYRRVPAWYNDPDFIMPAMPQDALPEHERTGFYFSFDVPKRTGVTLAVLRTNPRTGEIIDPRTYTPFLRFANEPGGQNFYTPGSWGNPPWIDGAKISQGIIRQFFFVDRATGLSLDEYTLPPELQGSDSIMIQFWRCLIPEPEVKRWRSESFGLESAPAKSVGVALGGRMAQRVNDIPEVDIAGQMLWNNRAWMPGPAVTIRICPVPLFEEIKGFSTSARQQTALQQKQNWPAQSGYPSPADMKGNLRF